MAGFYVIYRLVFSEYRSIRPVEINQYDITMANHYNITMGNEIARDGVAKDIHCNITMSNDVTMYTYHEIIMHNDFAMNLFYYIYSLLYA